MAQIYLDDEEYDELVSFFMDNFEITLTDARQYAEDLLNQLDFGKIVDEEPEKEEPSGEQGDKSVGL